jgi:energy-coupling factor transport system permease protein
MNIFLYLDRNTLIHHLDPRTKLIATTLLFGICLCFNHPLFLAVICVGIFLLGLAAAALPNFWKLRHILLLLVLFSTLLWPFFVKGPTLWWTWGPFQISRESFFYGLGMGLRLSAFVGIGLIFLSTTRNEELTNGLIRLGIPYPLAFAFSTALRLVPTFVGAGATIIQAQVARGLDLESGNLFKRIGQFIPQAVPLFIYAVHQTNFLAMALESRGFDPKAKRTFYFDPRMKTRDFLIVAFTFGLFLCSLYFRLGLGWGIIIAGRM